MSLSQSLKEVKSGLADERKNVRRIADQTERKLDEISAQLEQIEGRITPNNLRGFIRNYRFGMNGDAIKHPTDEALPTHRFDLEVGQAVWLHCVVGSDQWDGFMASNTGSINADFEETTDPAEYWDGKRIEVARNPSLDRYVPVNILGTTRLGPDRNGRDLYEGDRVKILDGSPNEGEVRAYADTNAAYEVRRDDGAAGGGRFDEGYGEFGARLYLVSASAIELIDS